MVREVLFSFCNSDEFRGSQCERNMLEKFCLKNIVSFSNARRELKRERERQRRQWHKSYLKGNKRVLLTCAKKYFEGTDKAFGAGE